MAAALAITFVVEGKTSVLVVHLDTRRGAKR
jgi:hypothetical protein